MVANAQDNQNLVAPGDGCPDCGERDADRLVWLDDDRVECQACRAIYRPGQERDDA
jgi:hypothetical protein